MMADLPPEGSGPGRSGHLREHRAAHGGRHRTAGNTVCMGLLSMKELE
jgi:hypothetical protein